jgi:hypothetical protein
MPTTALRAALLRIATIDNKQTGRAINEVKRRTPCLLNTIHIPK